MNRVIAFLLVAALGNAIYHLGQKTAPSGANPLLVLMAVYALAFLMTALAAPFLPGGLGPIDWGLLTRWPLWLLALGAVLIELGFLMAYRSGGALQWSGVVMNGVAALLLLPFAVLAFREPLNPSRIIGIGVTLAGMWLLTRK